MAAKKKIPAAVPESERAMRDVTGSIDEAIQKPMSRKDAIVWLEELSNYIESLSDGIRGDMKRYGEVDDEEA